MLLHDGDDAAKFKFLYGVSFTLTFASVEVVVAVVALLVFFPPI